MAHRFSIKTAFSRGWEVFTKRPLFFVGVLLLVIVIAIALQAPSIIVDVLTPDDLENANAAMVTAALIGVWVSLLFGLIAWAAQQYLSVGVLRLTLDAASGRPYSLKSLIIEPKLFLHAILASLVAGVLIFIGFLLLIIPGIYLSLAFAPLMYLVIDQKLGPVDAVQRCWELTKGNRGWLFLFGLASFGINMLGMLALGIGLFVTVPLTWLATADVYRQLTEKKS